jgi:RNA polymerase sigma factor (sigma-70 family)
MIERPVVERNHACTVFWVTAPPLLSSRDRRGGRSQEDGFDPLIQVLGVVYRMMTGSLDDSVVTTQTTSRSISPLGPRPVPRPPTRSGARLTAEADVGDAVLAFRQGNHRALEVLMARFEPSMRCVARRYVWCSQDVEDAVQDAWLAFARSADAIRSPMAVGGWLCVTTARAALTIARRQARCRPTERTLDVVSIDPDQVEIDDGASAVREAVGRLDAGDRELVWLLFASDLSYAEITERTGRAVGGIGPTRKRVIAKLRQDRSIRHLEAARAG